MIIQIILGLIGLGLVVFVHELGHFLAARATGIGIEVFSIGWGRRLWGKTLKDGSEFRISLLPLGGYLRMKGEYQFKDAMNRGLNYFPDEEGGFFTAHPIKRILVALAGPGINLVFAIIVFAVIFGIGYQYQTYSNKIVLITDVQADAESRAEQAGLQTGDSIIAIDNQETPYYSDIQQIIATSPNTLLNVRVKTIDGSTKNLTLTPLLDTERGIGVIGIYPYVLPIVSEVSGPAAEAGILPGDRILALNNQKIEHTLSIDPILSKNQGTLSVTVLRNTQEIEITLYPEYKEDDSIFLGLEFQGVTAKTAELNLFQAVGKGFSEVWRTLSLTVESLGLLFQGLNPAKAVSGPIRITAMVGEVAAAGMSQGIGVGLRITFQFLAFISIALAFGNLLPIPVLDGGQIVMYLYELISRKPLSPKQISRFQTVGAIIVLGLLGLAVFSDLLFITKG